MMNILCFGDSNTFGTNPSGGRWDLHERWPGVLQDELGSEYRMGANTGLSRKVSAGESR